MRLAICNEMFKDWPVERIASFAAEAGYAGIELAPFTLSKVPALPAAAERGKMRQVFAGAGLGVVGLHWLLAGVEGVSITSPEPSVRKRTLSYLRELAVLCRDLGGEVMVFGSPQQRKIGEGQAAEDAFERAAGLFRDLAGTTEECGVTVCFEPLTPRETDFINTMRQGVELVEEVGHPNFMLHLDAKALSGAEEKSPAEVIREEGGRYLRHFHVNDPNLMGPGMGELDHAPIAQALKEVKYNHWVSVETFTEGPGPEETARRSMETLRRFYI